MLCFVDKEMFDLFSPVFPIKLIRPVRVFLILSQHSAMVALQV